MRPHAPLEFARLVGGLAQGPQGRAVTGACTDSRLARPGSAFFATRGENADGHDYCRAALAAGAACVVVERHVEVEGPRVVVDSAVAALGRMARGLLTELDAPVLAVTGSVGKTTTREMLASILARRLTIFTAPRNYNTEIGVPLAIAQAEPGVRALVLEYAMRGRGQIRYLTDIAPPTVSAVLNVRTSHIELLGTRDAIAEAKAEILEGTLPSGVCCINADDDYADLLRARAAAPALTFGLSPSADARATDVTPEPDATGFTLEAGGSRQSVRIPAPGRHLVEDALCAAAMALAIGVEDLGAIAEGIAAFEPGERRGQVLLGREGARIIDDCYNAAPDSMQAAIEVLRARPDTGGRRIAVLGDILELGDYAPAAHRAVGALVAEAGVELLVTVGELARAYADAAVAAGLPRERTLSFSGASEAARGIAGLVADGDVVLVKGSRGIHLERVVEALVEGGTP